MRKALAVIVMAGAMTSGFAATAFADTTITTPGTPTCAGVTAGKITVGTGGVTVNGAQAYVNPVGTCV